MVFVDDFLFHHYSPPGADHIFPPKQKLFLSAFIVFDQSQSCENYDFKK